MFLRVANITRSWKQDVDYRFDFGEASIRPKEIHSGFDRARNSSTHLSGGTPNGERGIISARNVILREQRLPQLRRVFQNLLFPLSKRKICRTGKVLFRYGYYLDSPDPQLDQSQTVKAIEELQGFLLTISPTATGCQLPRTLSLKCKTNSHWKSCRTLSSIQSWRLHGQQLWVCNNHGSERPQELSLLQNIAKILNCWFWNQKYQEARLSIQEKQAERYRDVVDEYYSYTNNYPDSKKNRKEADNIFEIARKTRQE